MTTKIVWRVIRAKIETKILVVIFFGRVNFTPEILYFTTQMFEG